MSPKDNSLQDAGVLSANEQQMLVSKQEKLIKGLLIGVIACIILCWLIAPIIIGTALFILRKKQQVKLGLLQRGNLRVGRASGVLTKKNALRQTFTYSVGDYVLPQIFNAGIAAKSNIRQYEGQVITVEVLPEPSLIRCYYDGQGRGYNFITSSSMS